MKSIFLKKFILIKKIKERIRNTIKINNAL